MTPRTLIDVISGFEAKGFTSQFRARAGGVVECSACGETVDAAALEIADSARLEGVSDPADMMLIVAASCPGCGERGTLVLTYGPMAPQEDTEVEARLSLD